MGKIRRSSKASAALRSRKAFDAAKCVKHLALGGTGGGPGHQGWGAASSPLEV